MRTFLLFDYRIWLTIILSAGLGWMWNLCAPVFSMKPILLAAMPLGTLFFILMVTKPRWIVIMIILVRPLLDIILDQTRVGGGLGLGAVFNLTVILLVIFLGFYLMYFPRKVVPVYCWIFYLACMFISLFYTPVQSEGIRFWFNYLSYFSLFLIPFLIIKKQEDFDLLAKVFALSFVLPILYANVDLMRGGRYFEDAGMRITGTFTHPNILAFYLVLGFVFYFYLLKSGHLKFNPLIKFFIRVLMLNMLVLLIATKTRNAWISLYAAFLIYAFLKEKKMLIALILAVPILSLVPQVQERMVSVLKSESEGNYRGVNSFEWRKQMWQSSLVKVAERPLQGYGLKSFKYMSDQFSSYKNMGAHNTYLELAFETGLIGLISFIALFLSPLFVFFKNMSEAIDPLQAKIWAIMVGYCISYMLICSADNLLYYLVFNWYVWFFLGLMLVAVHRRYYV